MDIAIRAAAPSDYREAARLIGKEQSLHCQNRPDVFAGGSYAYGWEDFSRALEDEASILLAASEGSRLAGICFASVRKMEGPVLADRLTVFVEDFIVDDNYRKRGIGRRLISEMMERAGELGADSLELSVWEFNRDAVRIYEKLGFQTQSRQLEYRLKQRS